MCKINEVDFWQEKLEQWKSVENYKATMEENLPVPYKWNTQIVDGEVVGGKAAFVRCGPKTVYDRLKPEQKRAILCIQVEIDQRLIDFKVGIFSIGRLLANAKAILPHGQFKPWVQETWGRELPYSTAACFKAVYEKFKDTCTWKR